MKKRIFFKNWMILLVFVLGTVSPATGQIIYVDADAPGLNDGSSWENAYNYLQDALDDASSAPKPVEIWVAQGTYKPDQGVNQTLGNRNATFQLINDVTIKGGYAGFGEPNPNERDISLYETILSGDLDGDDIEQTKPKDMWLEPNRHENSYHVVTGHGTDEIAVINGVTISKGNANGDYWVYDHEGGGFFNRYGSPKLTNCTLIENSANGYGGGMYNFQCSPTLINCKFIRNFANDEGGGMRNYYGRPILVNCIFNDNSAGYNGGGIAGYGSSKPILVNCIFSGNSAGRNGGGMSNDWGGNAILVNCTFSGNSAEGYGGGIENNWTNCNPKLTNCILWYNIDKSGMGESSQIYSGIPIVNYSCIQNWTGSLGGNGNISFDPCFILRGYRDLNGVWVKGDYHLLLGSPCINTGDPNYVAESCETDLDGNPRVINGIVDMGAYEFGPIWYVDGVNGDDNNNGLNLKTAFATIQKGIDSAKDGDLVSVYPGVYHETIDFLGKAITVQSVDYPAVLQAQDYFAVLFYNGEGSDSILKNFVIKDSFMAILLNGSSPTIKNVTVVDNGFGVAAYGGAQPDISNSILWNNIYGDLFGCQARFSCVQDGSAGPGNLDIDPLFTDPDNGDYHLRSKYGRYWPQYDIWVLDKVISPCIDGGDPSDDYSDEPEPNGGRINMGAYGGTAYASMKQTRWLGSDVNHDGWVNMIDFAMLAENWLRCEPGTSNLPPEVSIINPQDGDMFRYNEPILIEADAWDPDGSVEWVDFLANGIWIGKDNDGNDGWKTYWQAPTWGIYNLTAEATDDDGATTTSSAVEIHSDVR